MCSPPLLQIWLSRGLAVGDHLDTRIHLGGRTVDLFECWSSDPLGMGINVRFNQRGSTTVALDEFSVRLCWLSEHFDGGNRWANSLVKKKRYRTDTYFWTKTSTDWNACVALALQPRPFIGDVRCRRRTLQANVNLSWFKSVVMSNPGNPRRFSTPCTTLQASNQGSSTWHVTSWFLAAWLSIFILPSFTVMSWCH